MVTPSPALSTVVSTPDVTKIGLFSRPLPDRTDSLPSPATFTVKVRPPKIGPLRFPSKRLNPIPIVLPNISSLSAARRPAILEPPVRDVRLDDA